VSTSVASVVTEVKVLPPKRQWPPTPSTSSRRHHRIGGGQPSRWRGFSDGAFAMGLDQASQLGELIE